MDQEIRDKVIATHTMMEGVSDTLAGAANSLFFKDDGSRFYIADNTTDKIQAFEI